jgi:hypothetical protein
MALHYEHSIDVARAPGDAFALLDDVSKTPTWLSRCVKLEKLDGGPIEVGTKLRYSYKEGRRVKAMDGEVTARVPNERLTYSYADKMAHVTVDFRMTSGEKGTRLTHAISIEPKHFMMKLLSPLIRRALPKQTVDAMEKVRALLESNAS